MRSPVFRHAGSWRHAGRAWWCPTQIAPRRWCGAVASAMACIVLCVNVVWCDDGLPPPPGWHHGGALRWSPHVADTPVGEIRGYARLQPLAGLGKCPPLVIGFAWGEVCDALHRGRTLRCARIGGGAMGVIGPIGPMGPIGGAAKQRVGARWWRCKAARGSMVVSLRSSAWSMVCRCGGGAWRLRAALPIGLIGPIGPILPIGPIAAATG